MQTSQRGRDREPSRQIDRDQPTRDAARAAPLQHHDRIAAGRTAAGDAARCPPYSRGHDRRLRPVRPVLPPRPDLRAHDRHRALTASTSPLECRGCRHVRADARNREYGRVEEAMQPRTTARASGGRAVSRTAGLVLDLGYASRSVISGLSCTRRHRYDWRRPQHWVSVNVKPHRSGSASSSLARSMIASNSSGSMRVRIIPPSAVANWSGRDA